MRGELDHYLNADFLVARRLAASTDPLLVEFDDRSVPWQEMKRFWYCTHPASPVRRVYKRGRGKESELAAILRDEASDEFETVSFPIDAVVTWVNHADPQWRRLYEEYHPNGRQALSGSDLDRYHNKNELLYMQRALFLHLPWIRRLHIVSNCRPPTWFDPREDRLCWVDHTEIFPSDALPVFNSHAIETRLHHIPGLAEHFVYFNDDFFVMKDLPREYFFQGNGISTSFLEDYRVVNGPRSPEDPDYINAARNGRDLLAEKYGVRPGRLHQHVPYALNRRVLDEIENDFEEAVQRTTRSRFRSIDDVSVPSFLYHHYAFLKGRSIIRHADSLILNVDNFKRYEEQEPEADFVCLNDGANSANNTNWLGFVDRFLSMKFPQGEISEMKHDSLP